MIPRRGRTDAEKEKEKQKERLTRHRQRSGGIGSTGVLYSKDDLYIVTHANKN